VDNKEHQTEVAEEAKIVTPFSELNIHRLRLASMNSPLAVFVLESGGSTFGYSTTFDRGHWFASEQIVKLTVNWLVVEIPSEGEISS
jgi:hypothetical protein